MKIVHLNNNDFHGGAAKLALRLHLAMLSKGMCSKLLVLVKKSSEREAYAIYNSRFNNLIASIRIRVERLILLYYPKSKNFTWNYSWLKSSIIKKINNEKADILHIHWIASGVGKINSFSKIDCPIVWTLHDAWIYTGGCHVIGDCKYYLKKCGVCPQLRDSQKGIDISRLGYISKYRFLKRKKDIIFIAPSNWIAEQAKKSSLLNGFQVEVISNGINEKIFTPYDKIKAREHFKINKEKFVILFGAVNSTKDKNKGLDLLIEALAILSKKNNLIGFQVVVFGNEEKVDFGINNLEVKCVGYVENEHHMAMLYSAADITCVPSRKESFGQTVVESMACGTPVIAFRGSGVDDIISSGKDGYLVQPYSVIEYADIINSLYDDSVLLKNISTKTRAKVVDEFTTEIMTRKYMMIYEKIIQNQTGK